MEVQDLAFAGQEVIFDISPIHRLEMATQNGNGDHIGNGCGLVVSLFDRVEYLGTPLEILVTLAIPLRDTGIQIPAVVVDAGLAGELLELCSRFHVEMQKRNHHVGYPHAAVVDGILYIDAATAVFSDT